jgi:hypothetical protein
MTVIDLFIASQKVSRLIDSSQFMRIFNCPGYKVMKELLLTDKLERM